MNPVVHFELPYENAARISAFYTQAFGWQNQAMGAEYNHYVVAHTSETIDGCTTRPGTINGGFYAKKPDWPAQYPSVVIAVDNLAEATAKVTAAGGKILGEPWDIPGVGAYISFLDTEGNRVSLLQPLPPRPDTE